MYDSARTVVPLAQVGIGAVSAAVAALAAVIGAAAVPVAAGVAEAASSHP